MTSYWNVKYVLAGISLTAWTTMVHAGGNREFIWTNESGFLSAQSCKVEEIDESRFRIANSRSKLQYENIRNSRKKIIGKLADRTLVKVTPNTRDVSRYHYIAVAGVHPLKGLNLRGMAKRNDEGFVYEKSLDGMDSYIVKVTDTPESVKSGRSTTHDVLPGTKYQIKDAFFQIVSQGKNLLAFNCGGKRYAAFDMHVASSRSAVARVGVNYDETKIFRDVYVYTVKEGEAAIESALASAGSSSSQAAAANSSKSSTDTDPEDKKNSSANGNSQSANNSTNSSASGEDQIVCTDKINGNLFVRDDKLNVLSQSGKMVRLDNGSAVTQAGSQVRKSGPYNYVQVRAGNLQGWVAKEFLKSDKASCPSLSVRYVCTSDGDDLIMRNSSMREMAKVQNLTELGQLGQSKNYKGLKYIKVQYGNEEGWVAEKFLAQSKDSCSSKGKTKPVIAQVPAEEVISCLGDRMLVIPGYYDCNQAGKCWGSKSKYKSRALCARFTKVGILNCRGSRSYIPCGEAKHCGPGMIAAGWVKLNHKSPRKAPIGAAVIYDWAGCGHRAGHIEIKVSESKWISDFIGGAPRNEVTRCRPVKAIYVKQ